MLAVFALRAGGSPWVTCLFFGTYLLMAMGLTKARAGLDPPMHEVIDKGPLKTMVSALGT